MMDIEKLIERLKAKDFERDYDCTPFECGVFGLLDTAATALSTLQAENAQLRADLEYEREHANAYYQECGQWEAENEKLRTELEQVTAERDAAIADIAAILAEVEEIRRGYGVDNADADNALANLCGNYCAKCGNNCYEEAENYRCKNYEWRGMKED